MHQRAAPQRGKVEQRLLIEARYKRCQPWRRRRHKEGTEIAQSARGSAFGACSEKKFGGARLIAVRLRRFGNPLDDPAHTRPGVLTHQFGDHGMETQYAVGHQ